MLASASLLPPSLPGEVLAVVKERGEPLGGVAYTCKDLAESLAGKDRYEFDKFFDPRTVLTLSESIARFIDTRQRIPV